MGRISDTGLYPFDTAITPNDYVIGTDGDNLNATKNFKVSTMLGYLGNMFNLQSQDLYYTYNAVAAGSVGTGEISSNNYADETILTSGVTNLYVSKLTELGALVDTYLNAIATDQLTVIVMDLSAPENYLVFNLTGSSDVDANTINLAGTVSESNGELVAGRSIGLKLTAGGGGGDFVDLVSNQTAAGNKTWTGTAFFNGNIIHSGFIATLQRVTSLYLDTKLFIWDRQGASIVQSIGSNTGFSLVGDFFGQPHYFFGKILSTGSTGTTFANIDGGFLDFNSLTAQRKYAFPDESGTIALTSSFPTYETGTFTPVIAATSGGSYTYTLAFANYTRIGDICHFNIVFNTITDSVSPPPSGATQITGMPFTANGTSVFPIELVCDSPTFYSAHGRITSGQTIITINFQRGLDSSNQGSSLISWSGVGVLNVSGSYKIVEP